MKKEISNKEFIQILNDNNFYYHRSSGDHDIYKQKDTGYIFSIPYKRKKLSIVLLYQFNRKFVNNKVPVLTGGKKY